MWLAVSAAIAVTAGCGTETGDQASAPSGGPVGDADDVYSAVQHLRSLGMGFTLEPQSLADALPNREIVIKTSTKTITSRFSDAAVAGQFTAVMPDEGLVWTNDDGTDRADDDPKIVDFDDPAADERSAIVTMEVDWVCGLGDAETVDFRIGVPVEADPDKFLAGLRDFETAIVLLQRDPSGRREGELRPILQSAGLGEIDEQDNLHFEGLGDDQTRFLDGLDTLDELQAECAADTVTLKY